ncbi:MAG: GlsB/YeaQ/YmgE family stress response membrane protein [Acidobacteria bacterium]|nr:GlsB/YeaQ/YmgE family stress response membrane protein [Acidobacteriota bacterium]
MIYSLISWIVFGLIAGALAKLIMPGKDPGGFIITVLLGIAGAVIGGFLAHLLGVAGETGHFGDRGFLIRMVFAIVGAIILLALYRMIAGKRA